MEEYKYQPKSLHDFFMSTGLIILNRRTEPIFMDCRRQEIIDIIICSKRLMDLVTKEFLENPLAWTNRYILPLNMWWKKNGTTIPNTQTGRAIRADLEAILKKAPSRFHTLDNLEVVAQYTSDAIIVAYKANCLLKPKNTSIRVFRNKEFSERRAEVKRL